MLKPRQQPKKLLHRKGSFRGACNLEAMIGTPEKQDNFQPEWEMKVCRDLPNLGWWKSNQGKRQE